MWRVLVALVALVAGSVAHANPPPTVLRLAAVAPDGTAWARELKAFARDVEQASQGRLQLKWYLGGIAGEEADALERIRRGQLDGAAGALFCQRLAPSMRVLRVIGLFKTRDESRYALARLKPRIDDEMARAGFAGLGYASFGIDRVFTQKPVRNFAELRSARLWVWDLDDVMIRMTRAMGLKVAPLPLEQARAAADNGQIDGFVAIPTAMLAYQWSLRVKHFLDLRLAEMPACLVMASRTFDRLPAVLRDDLRAAGAKLAVRFEDVGRVQDAQLVGGIFEKQGIGATPASESLRASFAAAARTARESAVGDGGIPRQLLEEVLSWLADYRGEHAEAAGD